MSEFDFDYVIIDWVTDEFTVIRGISEYTYGINEESWLLEGALASGVNFGEIEREETEETEECDEIEDELEAWWNEE